MRDNEEILKEREEEYNQIKGARVGDFLEYEDIMVRFSHDHGERLQTTRGGSFHLGNGFVSYSGGLDPGIDRDKIEDTGKRLKGRVWFFDKDVWGAGRGVDKEMNFRVFKIKDEHLNDIKPRDIIGSELCPVCKSAKVHHSPLKMKLNCDSCGFVEGEGFPENY